MASLRVLYIHQYFRTPDQGSSSRSWYFTRALVDAGHKPVVITAHNSSKYACKDYEGVEVHYLPVFYDNALPFRKRIRAFIAFVFKAILLIRKLPDAHLAYVLSTPLTTGIIGMYLKRFKQVPYIFDVADLWPRAPIEVGAINNPILKKWLYKLEENIYRKAEYVVALSPAIRNDISDRYPAIEVKMIPNMADLNFFGKREKLFGSEKEGFNIVYFGAAGLANQLEFLLDAAEACQVKGLTVAFWVIAEGSRLSNIKNEAEQRGLTSMVTFFDYMSKDELRYKLALADAVYISFKDLPVLETGSPNKFFDGLAAGKMIIANFGGWIAELIEKEDIGFTYSPGHPEMFVDKIKPYLLNNDLSAEAGRRARHLAERSFSRKEHAARFVSLIEKTVQSKSGR